MRKELLASISITTLLVAGLAPAASAQIDNFQPSEEIDQVAPDPSIVVLVPVTIPDPDPVVNPGVSLDGAVLVTPTIPEEPPFPPEDDDDPKPPTFNPDFELCLNLKKICPPKIDDLLNPGGGTDPGDPGDDDPGDDDEPGDADDPGDDDPADDDPGDDSEDDEPTDSDDPDGDGSDDPGDDTNDTDDTDETDDADDDQADGSTGIDQPRPGNPSFTG